MKKIKLFIVDDQQILIDGIQSLLKSNDDIVVVGEAINGRIAIEKLKHGIVDVILMNIDMPIMNGCEATQIILNKYPSVKVIAFTSYNEKTLVESMLEAGAQGYLLKNIGLDQLISAIKKVNSGEKCFSSEISITLSKTERVHILSRKQDHLVEEQFTPREKEVLILIVEGLSNSEIGTKLGISMRTVDSHRTNLMKKLEVRNIAGLIRYAIQNGLIE